jgi:hypothetical protein
MTDRVPARPRSDRWWMRIGDVVVRFVWKLLWSWRR